MKTFTKTSKAIPMSLTLVFLVGLLTVYLSSCNHSKVGQPVSPTSAATSSDSSGTPPAKGKGVGKKDVVSSTVKPALPPPGSCLGNQQGWQYVSSIYQFNGIYLPEDVQKGKYLMFMTSNVSSDKFATMYQKYCFRRVVCGDGDVTSLTSPGLFSRNQLLITLPNGGPFGDCLATGKLASGWQNLVAKYSNTVLGYFIDEPSGNLTGADMSGVATVVHANHSSLWLDDYDTGVISNIFYFAAHNCHLADYAMLQYGDCIMNDADNAKLTNGWAGLGCYVGEDYNVFQYNLGSKFNSIWTMNGFPNAGSVAAWIQSNSGITNFAIYLTSSWSWADLDQFMTYADQAGFLGHQYQVYNYTYVCQTNCVNFTPPNSPSAGAGSSVYYGVWTNSAYYRGPVDPSTPGATVCSTLQSTAPTSQTVNVY